MHSLARTTRSSRLDGRLAADNRFKRYGPMDSHKVRTPDVQGQTFVEQVKRTRQMLREMTSEQVKQVIEFHRDLTFFEAVALAKREGRLIVPNDVHDRILNEAYDEVYLRQNYPIWTGTLVIYEKPNKPFGRRIVFGWKDDNHVNYSISFTVPEQFRGKSDCALVIEHPDFEILEISKDRDSKSRDFDLIDLGNNRYEIKLIDVANIHLIESFPGKDDWYKPHQGIPQGEPVRESKKARYLWRSNTAYISPVARGFYDFDVIGQYVLLGVGPSGGFGVAVVPLAPASEKS